MRAIPKYVTIYQINRIINLYLRGKNKKSIIKICKCNIKVVEAIIENKIPARLKARGIDKIIINIIIKAMEQGINCELISRYFKLKKDIPYFIFKYYNGNNALRSLNLEKRLIIKKIKN
jgi:hypothetical protein